MIGQQLLDKISEGDDEAIAHFRDILRLGVIEKEEIPRLLASVVEGMAAQSEKGADGVKMKFSLYSIASQLNLILLPPIGGSAVNGNAVEVAKKLSQVPDRDINCVQLYEDLIAVAMNGPDKALLGLDKKMQDAVRVTADNSFRQVISTGAALARMARLEMEPDSDFVRAAEKCLRTAAGYGNGEVSAFAREALEWVPQAACAADKALLLGTEYPDASSPQRMYAEFVFWAAEKVLSPGPKNGNNDYDIAMKQLVTYGARRGEIEMMFESESDRRNLDILMRNVENALLHALEGGASREAMENAAAGLESIGSDRVEDALERMVERLGEDNQAGFLASETLASIRGNKLEEIIELPPPRRTTPPPLNKARKPGPKSTMVQ